ncbi:MAG: zinc-ribbon domain-containing protein [Methanomicrobia archaeon]|nr:zinc-ribbon domain-containing protein [Methanomicrobia archaeon]
MTIYCKKCGATNEDDALFCEKCGAELEKGVPKEARGKKGIGDVLSEAFNTITENPMMIVPYLIPLALALIMVFVTWGSLVPIREIGPGFDFDTDFLYENALAFVGFASIFGILSWIFGIVATAFAINMTYNSVNGRKVTLSEAWSEIGAGKILILLIVFIITVILTFLGLFALCIGALIVYILLMFVNQGIIIDNLDIGATFSNSYNIAKNNFFDVLILALVFFVLSFLVTWIPYIGGILGVLVGMYGTVSYTILYLDRKL